MISCFAIILESGHLPQPGVMHVYSHAASRFVYTASRYWPSTAGTNNRVQQQYHDVNKLLHDNCITAVPGNTVDFVSLLLMYVYKQRSNVKQVLIVKPTTWYCCCVNGVYIPCRRTFLTASSLDQSAPGSPHRSAVSRATRMTPTSFSRACSTLRCHVVSQAVQQNEATR